MPRYDYTAVGHVTVDVLPDGAEQPGGTAFYSALQAARLGLRARILTQGDAREIEALLTPYRDELDGTHGSGELDVKVIPAPHTTTLRTEGEGHTRHQRLLAWAGPIATPIEVDTAILHLGPVARETPRAWLGAAGFVGLTPQGLVRTWDAAGKIELEPLRAAGVPERCDAWVLSERERTYCAVPLTGSAATGSASIGTLEAGALSSVLEAGAPSSALDGAVAGGAVVAITDGARPTTMFLPGGTPQRIPVPAIAAPADDLGAGDVFAAALFVALREGQDPARAAAFATAAAAVRIAGVGPAAIGGREAIAMRLTRPDRPTPSQ